MSYFWTTFEDRGKEVTVQQGGRYEALNRDTNPATVKRGTRGITPSSDIPELCVSGSARASLFAKIQSVQRSGKYHIYETTEEPDVKPSRADLDFGIIEEFRYNMKKHDKVTFSKHQVVNVRSIIIEHIQHSYESAGKNNVNRKYAEAVKNALANLIGNGTYPEEAFKQAKLEEFKEFADAYGIEQAKKAYDGVPEGYSDE